MPVAGLALGKDGSAGNVERGEQRGGSVPHVIVGDAFDIAQAHRQYRLGAVQGLNLALLVDAQHQRVVGWIQI